MIIFFSSFAAGEEKKQRKPLSRRKLPKKENKQPREKNPRA